LVTGGGCLVALAFMAAIPVVLVAALFAFLGHS
jgi:hypothetical protein